MPLPNLNHAGELPEGIHPATIDEVVVQFGSGTEQRKIVTEHLKCIYQLAKETGHLQQFLIFGSYITAKPNPNDIDVVIIFDDDFDVAACREDVKKTLEPSTGSNSIRCQCFLGTSLITVFRTPG